ncbi:CHRD domain-containing protein [Gemmatimonas sp. UBA7669]|uniref:CHRD domain-containing protein n=1 Tax=Gemmatimonas sp. UBA7669 TaxID=1946568 RepID=UPI0025B7F26D|nr:CHRD domain-containing protein [Gemmatimonas sp. UBA7669]
MTRHLWRSAASARPARTLAVLGLLTVGAASLSATPRVRDWAATLTGREGRKVSGTATAVPTADGKGVEVSVQLSGDTPGATRPWHVHVGSCSKSGGVFGGGRAYTPITIDAKGNGSAKATVPAVFADTSTYYVNIHDAAAAMSIIVACGDLARR